MIELLIRDYSPGDFIGVLDVYRDALRSLKVSKGGKHPDASIDKAISASDEDMFGQIAGYGVLLVAEVKGTNEIVGIGSLGTGRLNHLIGSTYSRAHYVKLAYQKGRMGVNVGTVLRQATIRRASSMGFRKVFGHATVESVGFHSRFGARFFPSYDMKNPDGSIAGCYYEFIIRESLLNNLPLEPFVFWVQDSFVALIRHFRKKKGR